MDRRLKKPKGSYVYRKLSSGVYTTPSGSHPWPNMFFYKHQIPSGLLETTEADIQKGLTKLKELV